MPINVRITGKGEERIHHGEHRGHREMSLNIKAGLQILEKFTGTRIFTDKHRLKIG
jgi:hypothetical protein